MGRIEMEVGYGWMDGDGIWKDGGGDGDGDGDGDGWSSRIIT